MRGASNRSSPAKAQRGLTVGFLTIAPSPYILDLFRIMEADGRIHPIVFYQEAHSPAFRWRPTALSVNSTLLKSRAIHFMGARLFFNSGAISEIGKRVYDLFVVAGYASLTSQVLIRWLRWKGIPWVFWGEVPGYTRRGHVGTALRQVAMSVVRSADGIAAVGSRATRYYRDLVPHASIENIPYFSDVEGFRYLSAAHEKRSACVNVLFCGQLVRRKGVDILLNAMLRLMKSYDVRLTLLGRGELEEELRSQIPSEFRQRVAFEGFRQIEELPRYFHKADIFALPSLHDGWGVVVNQALAAGLPIVSTDAVGAAIDLVEDGGNGRIVRAGDEQQLQAAIEELVVNAAQREAFGLRSRKLAERWTAGREVDRWVALFNQVLGRPAPSVAAPEE